MNARTVELVNDLLAEFGFNFGPLPSPVASKEEQEEFDLALNSPNTAETAANQTTTKVDNGSDETKHNESTPQKGKDDDEDNNPIPKGMSPQDLNPFR